MAVLNEENPLYILLRNASGGRRLKDLRTFLRFKEENSHEEMLGQFVLYKRSRDEEGYIL